MIDEKLNGRYLKSLVQKRMCTLQMIAYLIECCICKPA